MKSNALIRVRFAPSPTGHLHIGSLRTAFFNWLYARHTGGTFLIRIEDTDRERSTKEYEDSLLQSLQWTGIVSDEPIVYQFSRNDIHTRIAYQLIEKGKAYKCYCAEEELEAKKNKAIERQDTYQYDRTCRSLVSQKENQPFVIRFRVSVDEEILSFHDEIKGLVSIPSAQMDDFVIIRSDGVATYNFAVVQDDHDMQISHVIRGEDHLLNTFKQILLYQALEYTVPIFAHIPLILGSSGQKLSKRDAVTSVIEYKKQGYLPKALCNYLLRLGWSDGDKEIFTQTEMVESFSLQGVHSSGAKFDLEKLNWMNSVYIKGLTPKEILSILKNDMHKDLEKITVDWKEENLFRWISLYQDRVHTLLQLYDEIVNVYYLPKAYDWNSLHEIIEKESVVVLQLLQQEFENLSFNKEVLSNFMKDFCKTHEYKMAQVAQLLRFALLGSLSGPSVIDMLELFGRKEVLRRISFVMDSL